MPQTLQIRARRSAETWFSRFADAVRSYTVGPVSIATLKGQALKDFFGEGYQTSAGVAVTPENAYTVAAVYDAVNQSSGDVGKIPLTFLMADKTNGGTKPNTDNPAYWLLKTEANPDMSAFEFKRTLQAHALTCKGGFAEIERDGMGRPSALWPITPDRVQVAIRKTRTSRGLYRSELYYQIDGDPNNVIEGRDMLHIRGLGYDGYCAYPVIDKARQTIGIALAAQTFAGKFFGNNATFGGILSAIQDLDPEQAQQVRDQIEAVGKGPDRAWKWLVLGSGFKYYPAGVNPQESQMEAVRNQQTEDVARYFNMPPYKLKMQKAGAVGYSSVEMFDLDYYKGHLLTWFTTWEQELNRKLVPSREWGNQFFKFNVNAFLRGDTAARTAMYTAMLDRGVFNADMVLDYEDLNPQPNGQGKLFLVQGAMVPKDKIVELVQTTIDKNKAAATPPEPAPAPDDRTDQIEQLERQVADAQARATEAERVASEARALADEEQAKRVTVEASQITTEADLTAARVREVAATAKATECEAVAVQLRAEVAAKEQALVAIQRERDEAVAGLTTDLQAATERVAEAMARAEAAERDLSTEQGAREELQSTLATVRAEMSAAEIAAQEMAAQRDADGQAAAALLKEARAAGDAEREKVLCLQGDIDARNNKIDEVERIAAVLQSHLDGFREAGTAKDQTIRALEASLAMKDQERTALVSERDTFVATLDTVTRAREKADRDYEAAKALQADATASMIAAMRSLAFETMRRMVERETDRARGKGQQKDKLQAWMGDFYTSHAEYMRTALLPIVRVHLAFMRSADDPIETTRQIVHAYIERSKAQLHAMLVGDVDDLAGSLHQLLYRWEQERAQAFADDLMRQELEQAGLVEQTAKRKRRKVKFETVDGTITGATVEE